MQAGRKALRAQFRDAQDERGLARRLIDPAPEEPRDGVFPGRWPGFPVDRLPPDCLVIPLGINNKTCYLVDTTGQMLAIATNEWNKKTIAALFALTPNTPYFYWPRWGGKKLNADGEEVPRINGFDADAATACLMKACAERGLFDPGDKVRGRGGWADDDRRFIWHSGTRLFTAEAGRGKDGPTTKLSESPPGDIDGMFYARRPAAMTPWPEPIGDDESPAHDILKALRSWNWERDVLDPLLMLGWLAASYYGEALHWRPTAFVTGDRGRGKSSLQKFIKSILGPNLHTTADTTAAGIYQRVGQDTLPVAVDELEADADDRRVRAVIALARIASSGDEMFRGGQDHTGVTFRARNAFLFSSINPPAMEPAERSRMAMLGLRPLARIGGAEHRPENPQALGRQLLRRMMDQWPRFEPAFAVWQDTLAQAGFDGRGSDTYGVLLTCAQLALGEAGLEAAGLPVTEFARLGQMIASATANERAEQTDNWRGCLERLLSWTIDNFKGGERPIVGDVLDRAAKGFEGDGLALDEARARLMQCGLGIKRPDAGRPDIWLCVPRDGAGVEKIFVGTKWQGGVWTHALKQGPAEVVIRDLGNGQNVWISGMTKRCLLIDMAKFGTLTKGG